MATEFPDDTSLKVTRHIAAPVERVWRAFTDPVDMAAWMWAGWGANTEAKADVRVGGRYEVYTTAPELDPDWPTDRWGFLGNYCEVAENRRLSYTVHWDGPVGYNQTGEMVIDELVIVDMVADGTATQVAMWHGGLPADGQSAAEHARGIEAMFDALDELVATG